MEIVALSQQDLDFVKSVCIKVWGKYSDEFGYRSEKINRVNAMNHPKDWDSMLAMFDWKNQTEAYNLIWTEVCLRKTNGSDYTNLEKVGQVLQKALIPFI